MPQLHITRIADDDGQTTVEYATVMLFVVLVLVLALAAGVDGVLGGVASKIVSSLP
jgi:Flp pilus assembly pilin Flp